MVLIFIIINVNSNIAYAEKKVSMAISPSRVYDEQIGYGESKTFEFNIGNTIEGISEDLNINVKISAKLENEDKEIIDYKDILSFDKEEITIKANSVEKVKATINVPEDMLSENYIFYIDFEQTSIDGFPLGEQTSVLRVPMYVFIGSIEEYNNRVFGYEILDNYLLTNGKNTTLSNEILTNVKKALNPLKTYSIFNEIINEPLYNFKSKNTNTLDFNNSFYTLMKNCSTTSDKLNNNKYIKYNKDNIDEKILRAVRENNLITITLENKEDIKIELNNDTAKLVEQQLINIVKSKKNITLDVLMNNLMLPKNNNYSLPEIYFVNKVKNTGNIPIVIKGNYELLLNNMDKISDGVINSKTILQNETAEINTLIATEELSKGVYEVTQSVTSRNINNDVYGSFKVSNQRYLIASALSVFIILYYLIIASFIYIIFRKIKKVYKKN